MTKPANELSMVEAGKMLRDHTLTVQELWDACSSRAHARNPELNAYLELFPADGPAIQAAQKRIDTERDTAPALCGIPLAIKDNILIEGHLASAASQILSNYTATYDATVITKLKADGALFLGRANMDEFAMGSSTENSAFGPSKNPHDTSRVPGGSSGGSASAVAGHLALAALGTDTGGSIRQPAAHCGLVGLKPTYGRVSRSGAIALGSSLDQIGPLTKSVADAQLLYDVLKGHDPLDATTITDATYPAPKIKEKLIIGVPYDLLSDGIDEDVRATFDATLARLAEAGHTLVSVSLPTSEYALPTYYVIMPAEASTNLARYDGMRYGKSTTGKNLLDEYLGARTEGFGPETIRRILLGTFVLSSGYIDAYYRKADAAREVLTNEYDEAFKTCDVIAFPTTPAPAFAFGEKTGNPVSMYLEDVFTVTACLTGMPAISVPMGMVERGGKQLPIGMHFTAPKGAESILFTAGALITGEALY
ncbi:MAG: Asp-tRNA(Asn)/Glu-tRNA(Gln) amidotransferase subunit GatA [Patescibacteria group bacterium]